MCTFLSRDSLSFSSDFQNAFGPRKNEAAPTECILLRPAGISARALLHRLPGQPSHDCILAPGTGKAPHPARVVAGCLSITCPLPQAATASESRVMTCRFPPHPFPSSKTVSFPLSYKWRRRPLGQYSAVFQGPSLHRQAA